MINIGFSIPSVAVRSARRGIGSLNPLVWFDPSDLRTLFQDGAGIAPVTGPGQRVGLMLDKSDSLVRGPDVVTDGDFSESGTHWATNGSTALVDKGVRIYSPDGSYSNVAQANVLMIGKWYIVEYTVAAYGFGSLTISGMPGNPSLPVTVGRHSILLQTTVEYLSIKRRSGPADVTIADLSVREIAGHHAVQSLNTGYRPTLARHPASGIRNLLDNSPTFEGWNENAGILSASTFVAKEFEMVKLTARAGQNGLTFVDLPTTAEEFQTVTFSIIAAAAEYPILHFTGGSGFAASRGAFEVDLTTGAVLSGTPIVQDLGGGLYRVSTQLNCTGSGDKSLQIQPREHMGVDVTGDGVKGILLGQAQLELGAVATPYQNRRNRYDITEIGERTLWYLLDDQVEGKFVTSFPDLKSDATEFWADETGITIKGAQTIGAGDRVLPGRARLYSYGIIDRPLTAPETAQLRCSLSLKSLT